MEKLRNSVVLVGTLAGVIGFGCGGGDQKTVDAIVLSPEAAQVRVGQTQAFAIEIQWDDGDVTTFDAGLQWRSSDDLVASIDNEGLATALAPGSVTITASIGGESMSSTLNVEPAIGTVTINPGDRSLLLGETQAFVLDVSFSDGTSGTFSAAADGVLWESSNESVATVNGSGLVTTMGEGLASISGSFEGQPAMANVTVSGQLIDGAVVINGFPVGGVTVNLQGDGAGASTTSDASDGSFSFMGLATGQYILVPVKDGYQFSPASIAVDLRTSTRVDIGDFQLASSDFPDAPDAYETDEDATTASSLTVGQAFQLRSIFPGGDVDWVAVELEAGKTYEFFMSNLGDTWDSTLEIYDATGTWLNGGDDHIDFDSQLVLSPQVSGTYYLRGESLGQGCSIGSYLLGALEFVDPDGDGYGAFHDCDNTTDAIAPWETDVPGDGIDQNCDGVDTPDASSADAQEPNDASPTATPLSYIQGSHEEGIFRGAENQQKISTLHNDADVDWWTFEIAARGVIELRLDGISYTASTGGAWPWPDYQATIYAADGATILDQGSGNRYYYNDTDTPITAFLVVNWAAADRMGWYLPVLVDLGVDVDDDGNATMSWDRDFDDNDPNSGACFGGGER